MASFTSMELAAGLSPHVVSHLHVVSWHFLSQMQEWKLQGPCHRLGSCTCHITAFSDQSKSRGQPRFKGLPILMAGGTQSQT